MTRTEAVAAPTRWGAQRITDRIGSAIGSNRSRATRTVRWSLCLALAVCCLWTATTPAYADACKLNKLVEFPITMVGPRPMMSAKINDVEVQFVVDSGAFWSTISPARAAELKLKTSPAPYGYYSVNGIGGTAAMSMATVQTFTLGGLAVHNAEFLVGGTETGQGSIGLLGQNFLHVGDVEYDLGHGMVRLMRPQDCSKASLAYWVSPSTPYSVIDTESESPLGDGNSAASRIGPTKLQVSHTIGHAFLNGTDIRVVFDTGAWTSILSLEAAARVGIKPDSPGVVSGGDTVGLGRNSVATYIAPFASFKIGNEEIKNVRLRIGDISFGDIGSKNAEMLVGADFFLSHRVYVANSQNKLYFTYNGGPVFNLNTGNRAVAEPATAALAPESGKAGEATEDAADYARRGAAFAARRDFDQAFAALTRACELAPDNPAYLYQRGMLYWQMKQPAPAMADFDQALKLRPDDLRTRLARAGLLLQRGDKDLAAADLDAADATTPKEADEHYQMADAYLRADRLAPAAAQMTLWIQSHADDARMPHALYLRCWIRALEGADLTLALKDCDAALRRVDKSTPFYAAGADSRGLVLLRMGAYDRSIADYDAALKVNPKNVQSWYGRGIAKLRRQQTSAGDADIAQATSLWPGVAEEFKRRGIVP
jgi:tetratricopeptide (TPR) repeat protein/predicted aspartyl protease